MRHPDDATDDLARQHARWTLGVLVRFCWFERLPTAPFWIVHGFDIFDGITGKLVQQERYLP